MPWLQSSVNIHRRIFVTEKDHAPLKRAMTIAAENDYKKILFKGIVVRTGEGFRVLREMAEEKEWAEKQKMAREAEAEL